MGTLPPSRYQARPVDSLGCHCWVRMEVTVKARDTAEFSTMNRTAPRAKNRLKFLSQHVNSIEVDKTSFRGTKLLMSGGCKTQVRTPSHHGEWVSISLLPWLVLTNHISDQMEQAGGISELSPPEVLPLPWSLVKAPGVNEYQPPRHGHRRSTQPQTASRRVSGMSDRSKSSRRTIQKSPAQTAEPQNGGCLTVCLEAIESRYTESKYISKGMSRHCTPRLKELMGTFQSTEAMEAQIRGSNRIPLGEWPRVGSTFKPGSCAYRTAMILPREPQVKWGNS